MLAPRARGAFTASAPRARGDFDLADAPPVVPRAPDVADRLQPLRVSLGDLAAAARFVQLRRIDLTQLVDPVGTVAARAHHDRETVTAEGRRRCDTWAVLEERA